MRSWKEEDCVEKACHVWWDLIVEIYYLSSGGEDEDQGCIVVGSISVRISPDLTPSGDRVAALDAEQVENIDENVEYLQP